MAGRRQDAGQAAKKDTKGLRLPGLKQKKKNKIRQLPSCNKGNRNPILKRLSVCRFCSVFSEKAQESISHLEQNYIRNFSVLRTAIYYTIKKKTIRAMNKMRLLRKYAGLPVQDHETVLHHFGTDHGECNVHIIRYLKKNTENTGNSWSGRMVPLLCRMNRERKALTGQGTKGKQKNKASIRQKRRKTCC